jgi:hypothetical protein
MKEGRRRADDSFRKTINKSAQQPPLLSSEQNVSKKVRTTYAFPSDAAPVHRLQKEMFHLTEESIPSYSIFYLFIYFFYQHRQSGCLQPSRTPSASNVFSLRQKVHDPFESENDSIKH